MTLTPLSFTLTVETIKPAVADMFIPNSVLSSVPVSLATPAREKSAQLSKVSGQYMKAPSNIHEPISIPYGMYT